MMKELEWYYDKLKDRACHKSNTTGTTSGEETVYPLVCRNTNPILSSFTTYYRVCHKSNTTGTTSGEETVYPLVCRNTNPILLSFTTWIGITTS
jgi:hypothetical protein